MRSLSHPTAPRLVAAAAAVMFAVGSLIWLVSGSTPSRSDPSAEPAAMPSTVGSPVGSQIPSASPVTQIGVDTFTSSVYGYSIGHPASWEARPASRPWTDEPLWPEPWFLTGADIADVLDGPGPWRLEVVAHEAPAGSDAADFVESGRLDRPQLKQAGVCRIRSTSWVPLGWDGRWMDASIGGFPALRRNACGLSDGVVLVGQRVYVFSLTTDKLFLHQYTGGVGFDELMDTVVFEDTVPPVGRAPGERITSELYGYQITIPPEWTATPATQAWLADRPRDRSVVDGFLYHGTSIIHPPVVSVSLTTLPAGLSLERWLETSIPVSRIWSDQPADCLDEWDATPIAGYPGFERRTHPSLARPCGVIDRAVAIGGLAYLFTAEGEADVGQSDRAHVAHDIEAALDAFVRSFAPAPVGDAVMTTFVSDRYGYALDHPVDWIVRPSGRSWVPGELPSRSDASDGFEDPRLGSPYSFAVASARVSDGMSEADWIARYVPPRGRWCRPRIAPAPPAPWAPVTIDGQQGAMRRACGFVDAVVVVDRRAYVISVAGPRGYEGATPETQALFDAVVPTLDLRQTPA
jgi:hypothetical protein